MKRNIRKHRVCAFHASLHYFIDCFSIEFKFQIQIQKHLDCILFSLSLSFPMGPAHLHFFFFLSLFSPCGPAHDIPSFFSSCPAWPGPVVFFPFLSPCYARPSMPRPTPRAPAFLSRLPPFLSLAGGTHLPRPSPTSS
jgi:hypothetical protein